MTAWNRILRPRPLLALAVAVGASVAVIAQIDGGDRGVAPIESSSSFEVSGVAVDVSASTSEAARYGGWREAQRKAWRALWQRVHGNGGAPGLSDSALDGIVAGIIVENEQIGPKRYIAKLGVLFDRARTGQILGVTGQTLRSPPMLVIPVQWSGGVPQSMEVRTEWQQAWARFRTGNSAVDYVRPTGSGADPLILNVAQTGRPGRAAWRLLLDQYGAADVVVPTVRLDRKWPGGPVFGHFAAFHGPDHRFIGAFTLRVENSAAIPQLLDAGVRRIDAEYVNALRDGRLRPDPSLVIEDPVEPTDLGDSLELAIDAPVDLTATQPGLVSITVQFDTPDVGTLNGVEAALRAVPGVRSAATTSLAMGGVSVMRVTFAGDQAGLRTALAARGWQVQEAAGTLRIRRQSGAAPAASPSAQPTP